MFVKNEIDQLLHGRGFLKAFPYAFAPLKILINEY